MRMRIREANRQLNEVKKTVAETLDEQFRRQNVLAQNYIERLETSLAANDYVRTEYLREVFNYSKNDWAFRPDIRKYIKEIVAKYGKSW